MGEHVCLEVTGLRAGVGALCAVEGFFSRMLFIVCLEVRSCCAGEFTLFAAEGLLS